MKILKKTLKIILIGLILLAVGLTTYIYNSGPDFPKGTDELIDSIMNQPLVEIMKGKTGFVTSHGHNIWYECITPNNSCKGTVLLIMGISNDASAWPKKFIDIFVEDGYQVIKYDNRGTGMSDWMEDWDADNPYSLADMGEDGIQILNALNVKKAHIIGVSMGGMIAQEIAINYPERVASLNSVMSSGFIMDPDLPPISTDVTLKLIKIWLKYGLIGGEKGMIKMQIASRIILMGNANYDLNIDEITKQVIYNLRKRKGYNTGTSSQQQAAVYESGSRYEKLKRLDIPTLIIHGNSDPFIPIEHGKKCASLIPDADTLWLKNMGHDIPDIHLDTISNRIINNFLRSK